MSKELTIDLGETGLTVTASVYLLGVLKASGIACAEIGVTGKYSGDFTASPNVAGVYQVAFFKGAETVSSGGGQIVWDGAAEIVQTGDSFARLGAPAGASVSADIAAIEAQTDDIGIAGAGLTALGDARLANLDVAVSSRTKPADTQARVTLVDTTTNLTNPPAVPSAATIADAVWDEALATHAVSGSTGAALSVSVAVGDPWAVAVPGAYAVGTAGYKFGTIIAAGAGAITWPYTVTDSGSGLPIADVDVWVTSDRAGLNVLASGRTNSSGVVTFYLDAGVAYFWSQKSGVNFSNPDQETIA